MVQVIEDARRRERTGSARIPPHNLHAEESLLGAMLLSRDAIAAAVETCAADDLYKPAHGHVFDAVTTLYSRGEPADPVTVADELARAGLLEPVGTPVEASPDDHHRPTRTSMPPSHRLRLVMLDSCSVTVRAAPSVGQRGDAGGRWRFRGGLRRDCAATRGALMPNEAQPRKAGDNVSAAQPVGSCIVAGDEPGGRFPDNAEADGSIASSPTKPLLEGYFWVDQKRGRLLHHGCTTNRRRVTSV